MYKEHQFTQLQGAPRAFRASSEVEVRKTGHLNLQPHFYRLSIEFTAA